MENIFILVISLILIVILIIVFFKNKEDYDYKIYLISLDKDIKRRNNILKNIRVDDIYSVDGSKLDKNKLKEDNILSEKANIKIGEIGCYLSHVYFLKKSLKNNKITLVLEDDTDISNYKLNEIQNIINKAPKNFEILFIGHNYYEKKENYDENFNYNEVKLVFGAQCYIINNKLLTEEKINNLFPIEEPFDTVLAKKFICYTVTPKIININSMGNYSNTQNINTNNHKK